MTKIKFHSYFPKVFFDTATSLRPKSFLKDQRGSMQQDKTTEHLSRRDATIILFILANQRQYTIQ